MSTIDAQVLALLTEAADHGDPCPANADIADAIGAGAAYQVRNALMRLERHGFLTLRRFGGRYCVTITRTGKATLSAADVADSRGRKHLDRRVAYCGLTPLEQQVMDLHDQIDPPLKIRDIAAIVGKPELHVRKIIYCYDGTGDQARDARAGAAGSKALLAAIARHHPERLAA